MSGCGNCGGNCEHCGGCGGCASALTLTRGELEILEKLAQIPFLPVARKADDPAPVYLEDAARSARQYSLILQCLEKKGLISLDFDMPLKGAYGDAYAAFPIRGSFALTARGQRVLELLEIQGAEDFGEE